jgi:hypothetical protein
LHTIIIKAAAATWQQQQQQQQRQQQNHETSSDQTYHAAGNAWRNICFNCIVTKLLAGMHAVPSKTYAD